MKMSLEFDIEISDIPTSFRAYCPELRIYQDFYTIEGAVEYLKIMARHEIYKIIEALPMPSDEMIKLIKEK